MTTKPPVEHTTTTYAEPGGTWVAACQCPWLSRGHNSRRGASHAAQKHRKQVVLTLEGEPAATDPGEGSFRSNNRVQCKGCLSYYTWEHGGWTKGRVSRWMCWNCQSRYQARQAGIRPLNREESS